MKLLIAIAALGLCSAALAAPVGWPPPNAAPVPEPVVVLKSDLGFNLLPTEVVFPKDESSPLVTMTIDSGTAPKADFQPASRAESAGFRVPEPSPLESVSLGLTFFGLLALLRRRRTKKRRRRRRTLVKMRAIIGER